jgi:hypothetical protein
MLVIAGASGRAGAEPKGAPLPDRRTESADAVVEQRVTCASVALFPIEGELQCAPAPLLDDRSLRHSNVERVPVNAGVERDEAVNYRALLGELVVTKDIEIPGLTGVGFRMIPSRSAVAGSPVPVVLIPRFVGTSWYGAEVVASF